MQIFLEESPATPRMPSELTCEHSMATLREAVMDVRTFVTESTFGVRGEGGKMERWRVRENFPAISVLANGFQGII